MIGFSAHKFDLSGQKETATGYYDSPPSVTGEVPSYIVFLVAI